MGIFAISVNVGRLIGVNMTYYRRLLKVISRPFAIQILSLLATKIPILFLIQLLFERLFRSHTYV